VRIGAALALTAIGDAKSPAYFRAASCDDNKYVRLIALSSMKTGQGESCKKTVMPGGAKDLPAGSMKAVKAGDREILLASPDTGIYAIDNVCTDRGCRLSAGTLEGGTVHCPCHGPVFNARTGEVEKGPAKIPLPAYAVVIENGGITLTR
jgi:nitrite reductase/ring-hydroxylating ferredoxin subunit